MRMKECPNCKRLIGEFADVCPNCDYDFHKKMVVERVAPTPAAAPAAPTPAPTPVPTPEMASKEKKKKESGFFRNVVAELRESTAGKPVEEVYEAAPEVAPVPTEIPVVEEYVQPEAEATPVYDYVPTPEPAPAPVYEAPTPAPAPAPAPVYTAPAYTAPAPAPAPMPTAFQYDSVVIATKNGAIDKEALDATLAEYAANGWKLHTMIMHENSKSQGSFGFGAVAQGTNGGDEMLLVFEKMM